MSTPQPPDGSDSSRPYGSAPNPYGVGPGQPNPYGAPSPQHGQPGPNGGQHGYGGYQVPPYQGGQHPGFVQASRPGTIPLRPLTLSDLLEGIFATLRRNPGAVLGISAIAAVAQAAVYMVVIYALFNALGDTMMTPGAEEFTEQEAFDLAATMLTWGGTSAAGVFVLTIFFTLLAQAVLGIVAVRSAVGVKTTLGQTLRLMRGSWGKLVLFMLLLMGVSVVVMALFGGLIAWAVFSWSEPSFGAAIATIVLGGIAATIITVWLSIKFCLTTTLIGVEQRGPFQALARSWRLTGGAWWRTFGIVLLVTLILGIVTSVITTPISMVSVLFIDENAAPDAMIQQTALITSIQTGISMFVSMFAQCLISILYGLFYVDYRIRREGFDRELVETATSVGAETDDRFSTRLNAQTLDGSSDDLVPGRPRS
ncbi:MAG: glycerophosphoryl diester phosphodiesterase membrane domain-containing protein [Micrococcaceae bacterium]